MPRVRTTKTVRQPRWSAVRGVLRTAIVERALPPGTPVIEEAVAECLHVSRNPVREALRNLESEGWLERRHPSGVQVRIPRGGEGVEVLGVRSVLEAHVAALAANRVTAHDLEPLDQIAVNGARAVERGDLNELLELNRAFHALLADLSGHQLLAELLSQLNLKVRWFYAAVAVDRAADSWEEHAELIRAITSRDPTAAERICHRHTQATLVAYSRYSEPGATELSAEEFYTALLGVIRQTRDAATDDRGANE